MTTHGTMKTKDVCFSYLENNKSISIEDAFAHDAGNLNSFYVVHTVGKLLFISFLLPIDIKKR